MTGVADLGVPTILFGVGTGELLTLMAQAGPTVVGVDWRVPLAEARRRVGPGHALQGNLDPALCLAPWAVVDEATRAVLASARSGNGSRVRRGHVFNLGHGVLPETDPGVLAAVVELVHAETAHADAPHDDGRAGDGARHAGRTRTRSQPSTRASAGVGHPNPHSWPSSRRRYRAIGGVSPLAERTQAQVDGLRADARTASAANATSSPSAPSTSTR